MRTLFRTLVVGIVITCIGRVALAAPAPTDEIANWNQMLFRMGLIGGTSPLVMTRVAAIVQGAVFDAVNGIEPRYAPVHVPPAAPAGASQSRAEPLGAKQSPTPF